MKNLIYQFYNEGFATTFCMKPINYINKKIKNKKTQKCISFIIKFIYTLLVISLAILILYLKIA